MGINVDGLQVSSIRSRQARRKLLDLDSEERAWIDSTKRETQKRKQNARPMANPVLPRRRRHLLQLKRPRRLLHPQMI